MFKKIYSNLNLIKYWTHIPLILRAIIIGLIVSTIGIITWTGSATLIQFPWLIIEMVIVFWLYIKYFSGSWWPKSTAYLRKVNFRKVKLPMNYWLLGIIGAIIFVIISQSAFIVTFRIIEYPATLFTSGYNLDEITPIWLAWIVIIISSLAAGIFEEIGFRGYMQVPLEKKYNPKIGILIVSIMFVLFHLNQVWAPPVLINLFGLSVLLGILAYVTDSLIPSIIGHTIMDVFMFSFWWSNVAGKFELTTIFKTGIDIHFIVFILIFVLSFISFCVIILTIHNIKSN